MGSKQELPRLTKAACQSVFAESAPAVSLYLTRCHVAFASPRYKLETDLPLNVDVTDVLARGAEWSQKDKAMRIWGKLATE